MTGSAEKFITPLTFAALTGSKVFTDIFSPVDAESIPHISLAKKADMVLIAPASANTIAKLANGIADNLLTTIVLAARAPVVICPAMNSAMYCHKATQNNISTLKDYGYTVVDAEEGALACGDEGPGRLLLWEKVREILFSLLSPQDLKGQNIVITAGPTREMIDPVRFISNRSSGRMGYALAATARRRGARVTLISGPSSLPAPPGISCVRVTSAMEMHDAVMEHVKSATIVVKAAAVADYRPTTVAAHKIKKGGESFSLALQPCPDILKELGSRKQKAADFPFLVGFAAESGNHVSEGQRKLEEKNLDLIVINDILSAETGFDAETNRVIMLDRDQNQTELPLLSKEETADHIWHNVLRLLKSESS